VYGHPWRFAIAPLPAPGTVFPAYGIALLGLDDRHGDFASAAATHL
jgi:hypothetical protein